MAAAKGYLPILCDEGVFQILGEIAVFGALSDKQIYSVIKLLKQVSYVDCEYIFRKGDAPSHIYIIRKGKIKIVLDSAEGCLELMEFGIGQCFGEVSVLGIQPHEASAVSIGETELIVLPRDVLLSIFERDKELFGLLILNIARETARRLYQTDDILYHYVVRK